MSTFQKILLNLQNFWSEKGCILQQSHDLQTGAGTFNPETFLRALGPEPYNVCHVEISRRPTDGRYGENPNRLQRFHQFQVMMKPTPNNMQQLYLESLEAIGFDLSKHDIRFVHDDWESPTQGAAGLGWEVWCDGMEITQFTYFQQIGGIALTEIPAEIAYGLERIALFLQKQANVYDLAYNDTLTYGDVFLSAEKEYSRYNFEEASIEMWEKKFNECEKESQRMIEKGLPIPAYDMAIEASHSFNMLEARGAISTTARVAMIHRVRDLCCNAAKCYLEAREKSGFTLLQHQPPKKQRSLDPVEQISVHNADFLLEIGTQHLPANAIAAAVASLQTLFETFLTTHNISFETMDVFATAKRLAVLVHGISTYTQEVETEKKGPLIDAAFDAFGVLTKQGEGFFNSIGLNISTREQLDAEKRIAVKEHRLVYKIKKEKLYVGTLLQQHLKEMILAIKFPKKMRWGKEGVLFSRPITSLTVLFHKTLIDLEIEGVSSSKNVHLHGQMEGGMATISHPSEYVSKLSKGKVLVDIKERKAFIDRQLTEISKDAKCEVVSSEKVTSEVLFLSEYPILAVGEFEKKFLSLPEELIFSEMIDHQKYYPMRGENGKISTKFIVALDKKPTDMMIANYENVLTARLSDGLFLFEKDLKSSFDLWNKKLSQVVLHPKLGSLYNKVERICLLSDTLADILKIKICKNAPLYCKADLVSEVVYEFPELQGTMGKYYAIHFGESQETSHAIEETYLPKSEGGSLPLTKSGLIVALADRIDNLLSYIGIGLMPTSSKDPYALRRSAVGVLRILIEHKLAIDLRLVIEDQKICEFIIARMHSLLKEYGFAGADIEMCGIYNSCNPYYIYKCVEAISHVRDTTNTFSRLIEVYKRVKGSVGESSYEAISEGALVETQEKELFKVVKRLKDSYQTLLQKGNYEEAFNSLVELVSPLEAFFENVRVQTDDEKLKKNRVALLMIPYKLISSTLRF